MPKPRETGKGQGDGKDGKNQAAALIINGFTLDTWLEKEGVAAVDDDLIFSGTGEGTEGVYFYVDGVAIGEVDWAEQENDNGSYNWSFGLSRDDLVSAGLFAEDTVGAGLSAEDTYEVRIGVETASKNHRSANAIFSEPYGLTIDQSVTSSINGLRLNANAAPGDWLTQDNSVVVTGSADVGATAQLAGTSAEPDAQEASPEDAGRFVPTDPLYSSQWHLNMLDDQGDAEWAIEKIWNDYNGAGVSIGIFDDGIEYSHSDLDDNYDATRHLIYLGEVLDAGPTTSQEAVHGTAVAGVIGAEANGEGSVGIAFGASLTGVNIFSGPAYINDPIPDGYASVADQQYRFDVVNHSWGALPVYINDLTDQTIATLDGWQRATSEGRDGYGTIVVKAAGNSADSAHGDAINNSRFAIITGAHDWEGDASWYTNRGPSLLISAPTSGNTEEGDLRIITTDRLGGEGYAPGDYTGTDQTGFGGTSSSAPTVTGVVALMLEANPELGWRDVQTILSYSAHGLGSYDGPLAEPTESVPVDEDGDGVVDYYTTLPVEYDSWRYNGADNWNGGGLHYSGDYGYGGVNVYNAVRMAEAWSLLGAAQTSANEIVVEDIARVIVPDDPNDPFASLSYNAHGANGEPDTVSATWTYSGEPIMLEYVTFSLEIELIYMEGLTITLTSPEGTTVTLMEPLLNDYSPLFTFLGIPWPTNWSWNFGLEAFRGEDPNGDWTLTLQEVNSTFDTENYPGYGELEGGKVNWFEFDFYGQAESVNDNYHYTNEVFDALSDEPERLSLVDDAGQDWLNLAAMTGDLTVNLAADGTGSAAMAGSGTFIEIASGTVIENVVSGDGADFLLGNDGANNLYGMRGSDLILGGAGTDTLSGGDDDDTLRGGMGSDTLNGDEGNDVLWGGDASGSGDSADTLNGGAGADYLYGEDGDDQLNGDADNDRLYGGNGADTLSGGAGADIAYGEDGNDTIWGDFAGGAGTGAGDDILLGGAGNDVINGEDGNDIVYGEADDDTLSGGAGNDTFRGGTGADTINGDAGADVLWGDSANTAGGVGDGADILNGGAGDDYLYGEGGDDQINGGDDNDRFYGGDGIDTILGGAGDDIGYGDAGNDIMWGDFGGAPTGVEGNDIMVGGDGDDLMYGEGGDDILLGQGDNDTIYGADGNDELRGGDGMDLLEGEAGNDRLRGEGGNDTLNGDDGHDSLVGGAGIDILNGGDGDDDLWGDSANTTGGVGDADDQLYAGAGNDILHGEGGNDTLDAGSGDDKVYGGSGNDTMVGGAGNDNMYGEDGDDHMTGGTGIDWMIGGDGADTLIGLDDNDYLWGGNGDDSLSGGSGTDRFWFRGSFGRDTITDYAAGELLDVRTTGVTYGDLQFANVSGNLEISSASWGAGDVIVLAGVTDSSLAESAFIF